MLRSVLLVTVLAVSIQKNQASQHEFDRELRGSRHNQLMHKVKELNRRMDALAQREQAQTSPPSPPPSADAVSTPEQITEHTQLQVDPHVINAFEEKKKGDLGNTGTETGTDSDESLEQHSQVPVADLINASLSNITGDIGVSNAINATKPMRANESGNATTSLSESEMKTKRHDRTLLIFLIFAVVMVPCILIVLWNCCSQEVDEDESIDEALSPKFPDADVQSPVVAAEPSLPMNAKVEPAKEPQQRPSQPNAADQDVKSFNTDKEMSVDVFKSNMDAYIGK